MYKENYSACLAFKNMGTTIAIQQNDFYDAGWRQDLPWIYYNQTGTEVIEKASRVQGKARFQTSATDKLGILRFVLGMYSLEGDFLGFQDLGSQLQLCPADYEDTIDFRRFGTSVNARCDYNISQLIDTNLQPNNTDVFYDLWLVDVNGNYIDVPVKINNYIDSNGSKPNQSKDKSKWKLTRRFFIYDTKSGLEGANSYKNGIKFGSYIRWLDKVKFVVQLRSEGSDEIYVPYVELEYRSKALTFIPDSKTTKVIYKVEYTMDPSSFWTVAWVFFGIGHIFIFIMAGWKIYVWTARHPKSLMGSVYMYKFIFNAAQFFLESWSTIVFWYLFAVSASFYFFFKLDQAPYLVMPQDENGNLLPFSIIFGIVFTLKIILLFVRIFRQSKSSFYVLDREKNMSSLHHILTNTLQQKSSEDRDFYEREYKEYEEPKAWRSIFIMNELNELLSSNIISIEVVLIWMGFILVGERWEFASLYDPRVLHGDSRSPSSYILMFFLFTLSIMIIGITLYILRYTVSFILPLDYMNFIDLCSVANVSLFIFDEKFHGYYIHGESPANSSDVTLDVLKKALDSEGQGLGKKRGLTENNPNLQTYEFYLPYSERKLFDEVFEECSQKSKKNKQSAYKKTPKVDFIYKSGEIGMYEEDFRKVTKINLISNSNYRLSAKRMRWTST